jgi:hypothetical protein
MMDNTYLHTLHRNEICSQICQQNLGITLRHPWLLISQKIAWQHQLIHPVPREKIAVRSKR